VADYLRSTYPGLNLQGVPMERQALQLLVSQQARYAVVDEAQLSRLSGEPEFSGLAVVGDIGLPQLLRVATRRDWPELSGIMESALRAIPARDLDQLHNRWLQPKYPRLSESPGLWQNLSLLLGLLLLASLAVVFWQRRQQRVLEHKLLAAREESAARAAGAEALRLTQFSIDQSTVGILWVNWDSHVRYANLAAETMLGYGPGALIERPLADFDPSLSMDRWLNLWKRARASDEGPQHFAADCLRADGSILPAEVSLSFLRFADGEYLVVYLNDVTERRRYVAALLQSEAQLRELSAHLETVREEEKARNRPRSTRRTRANAHRTQAGNLHVRAGLCATGPWPERALEQHETPDRPTVSIGARRGHGVAPANSRRRDRLGHRVAGAALRSAHADSLPGASPG